MCLLAPVGAELLLTTEGTKYRSHGLQEGFEWARIGSSGCSSVLPSGVRLYENATRPPFLADFRIV